MVEDRADLPNAIALNSTMVTGSRIIGPSIGGVIIAAVGEGWCFMIDAISYIAAIVSPLMMRVAKTEARPMKGGVGAGFMIEMASTNTILQTVVEEELRAA